VSNKFKIVFYGILAVICAIITPINIIDGADAWIIVINIIAFVSCSLTVFIAVKELA
jgi:UDP-N-acetylmuramyl pentapeptide phosphotransferase/UDP-N-acetylglucosamine-1-phosphate transferase